VVASSGRILRARPPAGPHIDANDAVVRLNYAPTEGFEKFVGSKTDFDLVSMSHAKTMLTRKSNPARLINSTLLVFEVGGGLPYAQL
jgi:hypothetical protein